MIFGSRADDNLDTAEKLFSAGKYHHCLFFAHLSLEKLLKALVIKETKEHALPTHNLTKLAEDAKVAATEEQKEELKEITVFNIEARYDSYKHSFYQKATKEYAKKWIDKTKERNKLLKSKI